MALIDIICTFLFLLTIAVAMKFKKKLKALLIRIMENEWKRFFLILSTLVAVGLIFGLMVEFMPLLTTIVSIIVFLILIPIAFGGS